MILNSASVAVSGKCKPLWNSRPICLASSLSTNTDLLRSQLEQLRLESDDARAKANHQRSRLLRLSEAAEKLQRQAAVSVQSGKENDARELLWQKKRVMQALEKSKNRIELLDELSAKLNEAISVKEKQLIGNVAVDVEFGVENASNPVRIVSPSEVVTEDTNMDKDYCANSYKSGTEQALQDCLGDQMIISTDKEPDDVPGSLSSQHGNGDFSNLREFSSYEDFLAHVDQQLNRIEAELVNFVNISSLVLDHEEKPKNPKLLHTMDLLESIRGMRHRITVMKGKEETR